MIKFYLITLFFCLACLGNLFAQAPTISSFSPTSGPVGTIVTINGSNLDNLTSLNIGSTSSVVVSNTGTQLVGMVMPGATTGALSATTSTGTASGTGNFTVVNTPLPNAQQGNKLIGANYTGAAQQGFSVAISADGNTAAIGATQDNNQVGAVWIYVRNGGSWAQQGSKLVGSGYVGQSNQGSSLALSADGNTLIVGAYEDGYYAGAAWIFTRTNGTWAQQGAKLMGAGAVGGLEEGSSVAISADGNTALVGAIVGNCVWVFTRNNGIWTQQGNKLTGTGSIGSAFQGSSVALSADGNTALIGGFGDNNSIGAAWVFTRTNGVWAQQGGKIANPDRFDQSMFGWSTALSADGNIAVVGGKANDYNSGAAWVFTRSNGTWTTQQGDKLAATDAGFGSYVGSSVGISADGNLIMVGGYGANNNAGAAWSFVKNGTTWAQQGPKLIGSGNTGAAQLGQSLALSADGNTLISGGNSDNTNVGAAWVFTACPITETLPATLIKATGATLNGNVSDNSNNTTVNFEYSTAADLSNPVAVSATGLSPLPAGTGKSGYTAVLNNLTVGATYYFRINGTSVNGVNHGVIFSFKTVPGAPSITSFSPLNGQPGTLVTIVGTNLDNLSSVTIGGTAGITISNSGTQLVAMVMPGSTSGQIAVTTPGGTATATGNFTLMETPYPTTQQGGQFVGSGALITSSGSDQGRAVAISADGNTAVFSGPTDNGQTGAIWIYTRTNGVWAQQGSKLTGSTASYNSQMGVSVAISADGNTVIAGGSGDSANLGAAWVFVRNGTTWSQQGPKLAGSGNVGYAMQGTGVALSADGNTAVIYGSADNNNQGALWVFTRNGTTWSQQGTKLPAATDPMPTSEPNNQALAISADGSTILIGNFQDNNWQGSALIYSKTGNTWTQQGGKLIGTGSVGAARQGISVALSANGNVALIGGDDDNTEVGAAWVFTRNNGTWVQQGNKLVGTGTILIKTAEQGYVVALSADGTVAAVLGMDDGHDDGKFLNTGGIWIFKQNSGTWSQTKVLRVNGAQTAPLQIQGSMGISADGGTLIAGGSGNGNGGNVFFFNASNPVPSISSFSPSTAAKGGTITITGTNFTGATSVTFGGVAAQSFTVVSPTSITAVVGTGASGNIAVTTPGGTTTFAGFNFVPVPTITANGPLTFTAGGSVVLTANPGTGYSYQWLKDGVNMNGATSASFTATQGGSYTVSITLNGVSSVSNATVVSIVNIDAPTIAAGGPLTFNTGGSVVLSSSTGSGYTYQWAKDGVNINGATGSSFTATQSGSYTVTVSLNGQSNTSTATVVNVVNVPVPTITASGPLTFAPGGTVVLSSSTGTGYSYQWAKDGVNITGATNSSFTAAQGGAYTVIVSLSGVSNTSIATTVTVQSTSTPPAIITSGTLSDLSTVYGSPSPSTSISVSGTNLTTGVTITAPAGFEVSSDNVTFNNSITVGAAGTLSSTPVYIRLAASTPVGSYVGNIVLTSGTATTNVPMVYSMVTLPADNYKITINSATCRGSNNGSVNITAAQSLNYIAKISGNGVNTSYPFTTSVDINNLAAGPYSICITVAGQPSYQQCYDVTISEPKDLSVYSTINNADNTISLALSGGTQYNIELNGKQYTTTDNSITLPLARGNNDLTVTTDKLCQGVIQKLINISGIMAPYPNPFQNSLSLNLGDKVINNVAVEIQNLADGKLVYARQFVNQSGVLKLDLSDLRAGVYVLQLSMDNSQKIFKILKNEK